MILDAQVHIWAADTPDRPWIPGGADYAHSSGAFEAPDLTREMNRVGVDRALLVSPTWEGDRNDLVLQAADDYPDRFGAIVRFDVRDRSLAENVEQWAADPRVRGARVVFWRQSSEWLGDGTVDWFWPLAEGLDLRVMVYAPEKYAEVGELAAKYPDLRLALCHLGLGTTVRDEQMIPEVDQLLDLARLPNVAVKATSLPSFVTEPYPYRLLQAQLERIVDAFGPQRVFWGSDLSRLKGDYADLYRLFAEELSFVGPHELEWIMGKAACEWFNWPYEIQDTDQP